MSPVLVALALLSAAPENLDALPRTAATPEEFVLLGWQVESTTEGDLTRDGMADRVLVLLEAEGAGEQHRVLVVLARDKGGWRLLGRNKGLLLCAGCGGVKGGNGAPSVAVDKGVLSVTSAGGSRETWSHTHRFRLDARSGRLVLIGLDQETEDTLTGAKQSSSENYLTGESLQDTTPPRPEALRQLGDEDAAKEAAEQKPTRERGKVDKRTPALEDVKLLSL